MKISAIIPCRSGSKEIKNKNICIIGNLPLLAYSVAAGCRCKMIDDVFITSDSQEYLNHSIRYGSVIPILRPGSIAKDYSSDHEYFIHAIDYCEKESILLPDLWVLLRPTTPFRNIDLLEDAILKFTNQGSDFTSLRSAHKAPESPYKWFKLDKNGNKYEPFIDSMKIKETNFPRQNFDEAYIPDGYIDIVRTNHIKEGDLFGKNIMAYVSPQCIEIDTQTDLDVARSLYLADKDAKIAGLRLE